MDLSLSIAIGSSVQVAVFLAPVLVLASLVIGPAPMDLVLNGVRLLAVYVILGLAFLFVTPAGPHRDPGVPLCRTPDPAVV
jgi:Ca2+:H+ antiporter